LQITTSGGRFLLLFSCPFSFSISFQFGAFLIKRGLPILFKKLPFEKNSLNNFSNLLLTFTLPDLLPYNPTKSTTIIPNYI